MDQLIDILKDKDYKIKWAANIVYLAGFKQTAKFSDYNSYLTIREEIELMKKNEIVPIDKIKRNKTKGYITLNILIWGNESLLGLYNDLKENKNFTKLVLREHFNGIQSLEIYITNDKCDEFKKLKRVIDRL